MTVTMDEFEDFIELYKEQKIEKVSENDLRKAIRHFWNVASKPTVDDRIETLKSEGWIKRKSHSNNFEIKHEKDDPIEKIFGQAGPE